MPRPYQKPLLALDYWELATRYDLGSLKHGGDLVIGADGDLVTTVDGDLKLGDDQHNALHRLLVRWQMEAPLLAQMFDVVLGSEQKANDYNRMIEELLMRRPLDEAITAEYRELQAAIGINEVGPGNYAGAIAIALNNILRREWVDLGRPDSWDEVGEKIGGHAFGNVIEAATNNFRHGDEWALTDPPTKQQLVSIRIIADAFGAQLGPGGVRHPFRGNVCPKLLLVLSGGSFDSLADRFFGFARALAGC